MTIPPEGGRLKAHIFFDHGGRRGAFTIHVGHRGDIHLDIAAMASLVVILPADQHVDVGTGINIRKDRFGIFNSRRIYTEQEVLNFINEPNPVKAMLMFDRFPEGINGNEAQEVQR